MATVVWSHLWVLNMVCSFVSSWSVECLMMCNQAQAYSYRYFGLRIPLFIAQSIDKHVNISLPCTNENLSFL